MRVAQATLLCAAVASAIYTEQKPLNAPTFDTESVPKSPKKLVDTGVLRELEDALKSLTSEASELWDEVASLYPEAMKEAAKVLSKPKEHQRSHDSTWDYIMRGADVQALWSENAQGDMEREIDGKLETYDMRIKKVDPSALGIDTVKQYSGYLDDNENDKHLFYWFFESRNDPENDPVILWLNGGPGCSSLTGLFMELGPSSINGKIQPVINPFSWNSNASVIFLDQPVNVGYSYSSGQVSNTPAAGKDVYALLTLFFKQFPEYAKQPFHIAGESYGGHYLPVFAAEILAHKNRNINLQSIAIGNGLTDPLSQYPSYRPVACGQDAWPAVVDKATCQSMDNALPRCLSLIENCYNTESTWSCVPAAIYCNNAILGPYQRTGQNVYDVREKCKGGSLCYEEIEWISQYLNRKDVMKALGVEVSKYDGCNFDINRNFLFQGDWMKPFHRLVPGILNEIPVLIYAGDADFICNSAGNRAWTAALDWPGKKAFNAEEYKNLTLDGENTGAYGYFRGAKNLTYMNIHAAGHMVPYNQPLFSLDFFNRWIAGEFWATK